MSPEPKGIQPTKPLVKIPDERKQFLFDDVVDEWAGAGEQVNGVLDEWHPRVLRDDGVQPFVTEASPPNVFSPFHLIAQSLMAEFVWSPLSLLIV